MSDPAGREAQLSPLKRALLALDRMEARLQELEGRQSEPIAVIGWACRFPGGAVDPESFWDLLRRGGDAVSEVPPDRWDIDAYYDPDPQAPGKMYTRWGAFLDRVDGLDARFFGIPPREAMSMDPQQRLVLEVGWEALESAGLPAERLAGSRTGVFVGIMSNDYMRVQMKLGDPAWLDGYQATGNVFSAVAGRLSFLLGLEGPSLAVETACSSSLVAVHLACQSLRLGESEMALAGGVNLMLSPEATVSVCRAGMMAADGRCKTFDAAADGYVRGEGCGVVVLKRLSRARADGDAVLGLVRGSAVNQDGRSGGLTVPSGLAQQAVLRQALANAGVTPAEVCYVETHGTGTSLGDPIEMGALAAVLGEGRPAGRPVAVGSVKTNIGHLESAAGIAGLIKALLVLRHREVPPHLHLCAPSPHIPWSELPVEVPVRPTPLADAGRPPIAGVSAFGFIGTNCHVVLEAPPAEPPADRTAEPEDKHLLVLSARDAAALRDLAGAYRDLLAGESADGAQLADLCFCAAARRSHHEHRLAVSGRTRAVLAARLAAFLEGEAPDGLAAGRAAPGRRRRPVFVFGGQGWQRPGMGCELAAREPVFRAALEQCDELVRRHTGWSLLEEIAAGPERSRLDHTDVAQPAVFALQVALAALWRSWGIVPGAVIGHSLGEVAAAHVAGVLELDEAARLAVCRGREMERARGLGAMAVVGLPEDEAAGELAGLGGRLAVAAANGPGETVISGEADALSSLLAAWRARGVFCRELAGAYPFHSPLVAAFGADLERALAGLAPRPPALRIVSTVTGREAAAGDFTPGYWRHGIGAPVRFAAAVAELAGEGWDTFVELGPHPALRTAVADALGRRGVEGTVLGSLHRERGERESLLAALGALYAQGQEVDWSALYPRGGRPVRLPSYPWQRQRFWLGDDAPAAAPGPGCDLYEVVWRPCPLAEPTPAPEAGFWLLFSDRSGVGEALAGRLARRGEACVAVRAGAGGGALEADPDDPPAPARLLAGLPPGAGPCRGVVYLWALDAAAETTAASLAADGRWTAAALALLQALVAAPGLDGAPRLWLATRGAQPVSPQGRATVPAPVAVAQAPLWGLGRVAALEHPEAWGGLVDLDPAATSEECAAALLSTLGAAGSAGDLGWRGGRSYAARLERWPPGRALPAPVSLARDGTYLVTGGLGALGLATARLLVERGARHLVLAGRREPAEGARRALAELAAAGATVETVQADVSCPGEVAALLGRIAGTLPPLRGIVHAAGVLDDGLLVGQSRERLERVLAPKVQGAWNLHEQTRHLPLDVFVLFSSAAAVLGPPGQGGYAAANAFLDSLAHHRRALGLPAVSLGWGPWEGPGMAAGEGMAERWRRLGLEPLAPARALGLLGRLLATAPPQVGVLAADWQVLAREADDVARLPLLAGLTGGRAAGERRGGELAGQILAAPAPARRGLVESYLRCQVAQALGTVDEVPAGGDLLELGLDSLRTMDLIAACRRDLGLSLYPREVLLRPALDRLADYLTAELERVHGRGGASQAPEPPRESAAEAGRAGFPPRRRAAGAADRGVDGERVPGVVFLLSAPRSGSTLLRVMLAGHPGLFSPPELHLLPFADLAERRVALAAGALGEGLERALMELEGLDAAAARARVEELEGRGSSVQEVYALLRRLAAGRLLVDKSPSYALDPAALARAEALCAEPRYLLLTRHPWAVIDSFVRRRLHTLLGRDDAEPHALAEEVWTAANRAMAAVEERLGERCHRVRYEELVTAPRPVLEGVCRFLGLDFDPVVLEPYRRGRMTDGVHARSLPLGDPGFHEHRGIDPALADSWRRVRLPRPLGPPAVRLALRLGYSLPGLPASRPSVAPSVWAPRELDLPGRGVRLRACAWGPEAGPLVLCLHGLFDQGLAWEPVAAHLARLGFRVVAPDLRGHGASGHAGPAGGYRLVDFLGDLDTLFGALESPPCVLVGHSLGGLLAACWAGVRDRGLAALVLVEDVPPLPVPDGEAAGRLAAHLDLLAAPPAHAVLPGVAAAARTLRAVCSSLPENLALRLAGRSTEACAGGVRWRWDPLLKTPLALGSELAGYAAILGHIRVPATLVYGASSHVDEEHRRRMQAAVPGACRLTLPGGHHLHLDTPGLLADIIAGAGLDAATPTEEKSA